MFKLDKRFAFFAGLWVASSELQDYARRKKQARIDAVNADFDAQERLVQERIDLLEASVSDQVEDDLSWM